MTPTFVALDFETANDDRGSACAVGIVRVEGGEVVAKERRLINPQTYFLEGFTRDVHGIAQEDVEDAPLFDEVWQGLVPLLKDAEFIAAHKASFDKSVLNACCKKYGVQPPEQDFTCSIKAAKSFCKLSGYSLDVVCGHLGIELNHHEALSDALACARIMTMALERGYKV